MSRNPNEKYNLVIILCASALNNNGSFDELSFNGSYLGGQIRMEAAVDFAPNTDTYIVVGGDHKDGKYKKIDDMKNFLKKRFNELQLPKEQQPKIIRIYSATDTTGNLWAIKRAFRDTGKLNWFSNKRVGILTNFYHIPRAMRFAADIFNDVSVLFIPISAEAVIYRHKPTYTDYPKAILKRIKLELNGLRAWECKKYKNKQGQFVQSLPEKFWDSECLNKELLKTL